MYPHLKRPWLALPRRLGRGDSYTRTAAILHDKSPFSTRPDLPFLPTTLPGGGGGTFAPLPPPVVPVPQPNNNRQALLVLTETLLTTQRLMQTKMGAESSTEPVVEDTSTETPAPQQDWHAEMEHVADTAPESSSTQEKWQALSNRPEEDIITGATEPHEDNRGARGTDPDATTAATTRNTETSPESESNAASTFIRYRGANIAIEAFGTKFVKALLNREVGLCVMMFEIAEKNGVTHALPPKHILTFYHVLLLRKDPVTAYRVLQVYKKHMDIENDGRDRGYYLKLFLRLCKGVQTYDINRCDPYRMEALVRKMIHELKSFKKGDQKPALQFLVSSLIQQRLNSLGKMATLLYTYMVENDFKFEPAYLSHIVGCSRYNRRDELPYAELLAKAVMQGERPEPTSVCGLVENYFPHDDLDISRLLLRSLMELESQKDVKDNHRYIMDTTTLESMAATAARAGDVEAIGYMWEYLEASGIQPTEGLYESTAVAFCHDPERYRNAFAVFDEMPFKPSRALFRNMSKLIYPRIENFEKCFHLVLDDVEIWLNKQRHDDDGRSLFPLAAFNVVLASAAERGELTAATHMMHMVDKYDLPIDVDTFGFAFECLGKHLTFRSRNHIKDYGKLRSYLMGRAVEYLDMMDARKFQMTHHVVRHYVELLLAANEVETATHVVQDALKRAPMNNRVIHRVAMANAEKGYFQVAYELADQGTEPMPFLKNRITMLETGNGFSLSPEEMAR